jgi:hypothetical protein
MEANIQLKLKVLDQVDTEVKSNGIKHYVQELRKWVSKYVTFDKDAIFKDPNWPYLWS